MSPASELIRKLPAAFVAEAASGTDCTIQFEVSNPMHVTIRNGACTVHDGRSAAPDVSVRMADADFVALMTGELNGMAAFLSGRLAVDGDLLLAQRLPALFDSSRLG